MSTGRSPEPMSGFFAPVALGAGALGAITLLRAIVVVPIALLRGEAGVAGQALTVVALAAGAGALGGLTYSVVGRPLRRVPVVGPYAAGLVTVAAYLGSVLWAIGRIDPKAGVSITEPSGRAAYVFCVVIFGIALGRQFIRDAKESEEGFVDAT